MIGKYFQSSLDIPNVVRDQNNRYYSPSKYFNIKIESKAKFQKFVNKDLPEWSNSRKNFITKLNPAAVKVMKQRIEESK